MLSLQHIYKAYETGDSFIEVLKDITIDFRKNEFVSILGPSGCGKTTLLNIIGGLDQYSDGDMAVNGISTKKYKDRDWDSYRNHSVGFVFQSYNLIPHQTVLANVELALTLSGVSKSERKRRAVEVLNKVGLGDQLNKKPNQMSGGQVQRVAIARALINNPDILLADEPTGALDSKTSVQIMELLKEVAKDKLVIMVTHNPELAERYSTRIVRLLDGRIISDSNPYIPEPTPDDGNKKKKKAKRVKKPSMSFFTALSLSLNNLLTKKGRTFMTAFAGSIGIIGIALIVALSSGFNDYISRVEEETLSSYPLAIEEENVDMSSMVNLLMGANEEESKDYDENKIYSSNIMGDLMNSMTSEVKLNNMADFKKYIEDEKNGVKKLTSDIQYGYSLDLNIYRSETENGIVQVNPSVVFDLATGSEFISGMMSMGSAMNQQSMETWTQLLNNDELLHTQYKLVDGKWPERATDVVLIVNENNEISDLSLYTLGIKDQSEISGIMQNIMKGEGVKSERSEYTFDDFLGLTFKLVPNSAYYKEQENGTWLDMHDDEEYVKSLINDGISVEIVGIIKPGKDAVKQNNNAAIGYTYALTEDVINIINESKIVKQQKSDPEINVLTGRPFPTSDNSNKNDDNTSAEPATATDAVQSGFDISTLTPEEQKAFAAMSEADKQVFINNKLAADIPNRDFYINSLSPEQREYFESLTPQEQQQLIESMGTTDDSNTDESSYTSNLLSFGSVDLSKPSTINIYPKDFESKEKIIELIDSYNDDMRKNDREADVINYTDFIGLMISSVSTIINTITYVLIAFVAISLVVSSIMIGIITYISVLERTKEIGILRSIGASKRDISRVFRSETVIEGFVAGALGIIVTWILIFPINLIIKHISGISGVAHLPYQYAVILILISVALTLIAGVAPSRVAAKKDPVEALRTE